MATRYFHVFGHRTHDADLGALLDDCWDGDTVMLGSTVRDGQAHVIDAAITVDGRNRATIVAASRQVGLVVGTEDHAVEATVSNLTI